MYLKAEIQIQVNIQWKIHKKHLDACNIDSFLPAYTVYRIIYIYHKLRFLT